MTPTKAQRLRIAKAAQERLNKAEAKATEAASTRDQAVHDSQAQGATYAEIQEATGLSTARVTQVLRKVRLAQTTTD